MSLAHTSIGLFHLFSETIFQAHLMARPTHMVKARPNQIAARMILGTLVSVLGKARQNKRESLLEKTIVSYSVVLNI